MTKEQSDAAPPFHQQDEIMREVRANREAYVARFNHDVHAMFEHLRERAADEQLQGKKRKARRVEFKESA